MARPLVILSFGLAAALLAVTAYWMLFTTFMAYDDEGYVLISLANYSDHGGLYAQVYSQYGPFFYFLHDIGHRLLGYEFTNTTGRLITLSCWLLVAGASAHLVWRQTRAATLTGFTLGLTFFYLWHMVSEPIHPGGLIAALVAIGAWAGARQIERRAMPGLAVTAGLLGAALLLTKINVGVFFLAAAGAWFATRLRDSRQARVATIIAAALLVLLPVGLMWSQWGDGWGRLFGGLSVIASLTMLAAAWRDRQPLTTWRDAGWGGGALFLLGMAVVVTVCLRGTTLAGLLEGILFSPLRHPGVYHLAPTWQPGAGLAGGLSLLLGILVWNGQAMRLGWLFIGLRLTLVLAFGFASVEWTPFTVHSFVMSYAVPLAWIFAVRLTPDDPTDLQGPATWLGLLLVLQCLHAYPVAGSQIAWGTFLIVPLMALGLHDAQRFVGRCERSAVPTLIGLASLALAVGATGRLAHIGWHRYTESRPLRLPGAEDLRLPEVFASDVRVVALNAAAHGDMLFSLPGLYSFNNWTKLPAPTLANTTHWFSLLNRHQQEEIAAALDRSERPVLLVQPALVDYLTANSFSIVSPLDSYLRRNFARAFTLGQYEFWIRRGRIIAPLATAELFQLSAPQPGLPPVKLELTVAIPGGSKIARIELVALQESSQVLAIWDKTRGPLLGTGINLQGTALTPEISSAWDRPLPPLTRLTLPLEHPLSFDRSRVAIYLRGADGALLAEARFLSESPL